MFNDMAEQFTEKSAAQLLVMEELEILSLEKALMSNQYKFTLSPAKSNSEFLCESFIVQKGQELLEEKTMSKSQVLKASAPENIAIPNVSKLQISKVSASEDIAFPDACKSQISKSSPPEDIAFPDGDIPLDLSCSHSETSGLNDSSETPMKEETYDSDLLAEGPLDLSMQPAKKKYKFVKRLF